MKIVHVIERSRNEPGDGADQGRPGAIVDDVVGYDHQRGERDGA